MIKSSKSVSDIGSYFVQSHLYFLSSFRILITKSCCSISVVVSTCTDQSEMETQIVSAFDQVRENIEKQRAKMERAGMSADE